MEHIGMSSTVTRGCRQWLGIEADAFRFADRKFRAVKTRYVSRDFKNASIIKNGKSN